MGYASAVSFLDQCKDLRTAVEWHLAFNHYPSIPQTMVKPALEAIECVEDGEYDYRVKTPYPHRTYGHYVPASVLVEVLHLDAFLGVGYYQEEWPEDESLVEVSDDE